MSLRSSLFIANLHCIGRESLSGSSSFKFLAYLEAGNACMTVGQLDVILWRHRLDIPSIPCAALSKLTA